MTILPGKILIDRNNQTMHLNYEKDDNCKIDTPYGVINMKVHTQEMTITKKQNKITQILLKYKITLENGMQYDTIVTINLEY